MPARTVVLIDAVLGTGARGGWDPAVLPKIPSGVTVVACDLPSGVDADTGQVARGVIPADLTVTFGAQKTGLLVGAGAQAAGRVGRVDIGLGPYIPAPDVSSLEHDDALAVFAPPAWDDHKYSRGVLGVAAGSEQYPGAAVLVCSAAMASRLGMVQYAGPVSVRRHVLSALPEIVAGPDAKGKARAWVASSGLGAGDGARARLAGLVGSVLARTVHGDSVSTVEKAADAAWLHGSAGAQAAVDGTFGASALASAVRAVLVHRGQPPRID